MGDGKHFLGIDWSRAGKDLFAGSCAGIASIVVCYPMDIIRTRLQTTSSTKFTGAFDAFTKTIKGEGFTGLYKGMASPLAAQALQKSIMFGAYGTAKRWVQKGTEPLSLFDSFICGAVAGIANTTVASPIELIRNRLMVQYTGKAESKYKGPVDCMRQIVKADGILGLWKGMWPTLCRDGPGVGTYYAVFEMFRRYKTPEGQSSTFGVLMFSGAMAGIGYWVTAFPQDTIKSIIQTDTTGRYRGMLHCGMELVKEQGWKRLYRGFSLGIYRGIPGAATTFTTHALVFKAIGG